MKRANIKAYDNLYEGYILIETLDELQDYIENHLRGLQKNSMREFMDRLLIRAEGKNPGHATDDLLLISEMKSSITGCGVLISHAEIFGEIVASFIKIISNGDRLVINPYNGFSHFPLSKKYKYDIEIISNGDVYSEKDIRVFQWQGGVHWYAKIAQIDVVVDGEQKWNTKSLAEENAKKFLLNIKQPLPADSVDKK